MIALLLASPNIASYTFLLLCLPGALLLFTSARGRWPWILLPYMLIGAPVPAAFLPFFPRMWMLIVLFLEAGRGRWNSIQARPAFAAAAAIIALAIANMLQIEPRYDRLLTERDAILAPHRRRSRIAASFTSRLQTAVIC